MAITFIGLLIHLIVFSEKVKSGTIITEINRLSEAGLIAPDVTMCVKHGYFNKIRYENNKQLTLVYYRKKSLQTKAFIKAHTSRSTFTFDQIEQLVNSAEWSWHAANQRIVFETELLKQCLLLGQPCDILDYGEAGAVGQSRCVHFSLELMLARIAASKRSRTYPSNLLLVLAMPGKNSLSESTNAVLYIHQRGTYPDLVTGFSIIENDVLYVRPTAHHVENYNRASFQCQDNLEDIEVKMSNGKVKLFAYTESLCRARLFQTQVIEHCRCFSELVPSAVQSSLSLKNVRGGCHDIPAEFYDENWPKNDSRLNATVERIRCHEEQFQKYSDAAMKSICPKPCKETSYATQISNAKFSYEEFRLSDLSWLSERARKVRPHQNQTIWDSTFRLSKENNIPSVPFIFYKPPLAKAVIELDTESFSIKQKAMDSASIITGMCGSVLGLWFGASIISACEFFEFGFSVMIKKYGRSQKALLQNQDQG